MTLFSIVARYQNGPDSPHLHILPSALSIKAKPLEQPAAGSSDRALAKTHFLLERVPLAFLILTGPL